MAKSWFGAVVKIVLGISIASTASFAIAQEEKPATVPAARIQLSTGAKVAKTEKSKEAAEKAKKAQEARQEQIRKLMEQQQKEQKEAQEKLKQATQNAPYARAKEIKLGSKFINGFCVLPNGKVAVISGPPNVYGAAPQSPVEGNKHELSILSPEGVVETSAELSFAAKAVNVSDDGSIFVVGAGRIAQFDDSGKLHHNVESPHLAQVLSNREKIEKETRKRVEDQKKAMEEQVKQFKTAIEEYKKRKPEELTDEDKLQMASLQQYIDLVAQQSQATDAVPIEKQVEAAVAEVREIHRVCASKSDLFIVTREVGSYGFAVWRMNQDFSEPVQIIKGLAGCCGQMDIQCIDGKVCVAENSRHRVVLYDRDGKSSTSFGKANRTDITKGFGGCCNPMNTCRMTNGNIVTSESNGVVKSYEPNGNFVEVLGVADVVEGCKNSSVGVAPDGSKLYYFDVANGKLQVLDKKSS